MQRIDEIEKQSAESACNQSGFASDWVGGASLMNEWMKTLLLGQVHLAEGWKTLY